MTTHAIPEGPVDTRPAGFHDVGAQARILTARLPEVRDGLRAAMRQAEEKAARRATLRDTGETSHDGRDSGETP